MVQGAGLVLPGTLYHALTWYSSADFSPRNSQGFLWFGSTERPNWRFHQNRHFSSDLQSLFSEFSQKIGSPGTPRLLAGTATKSRKETSQPQFSFRKNMSDVPRSTLASVHDAPTTTQSRAWVFTLNNHSSVDVPNTFEGKYCIWQEEQGEAGTRHLQGYIVWNSPKRLSAIKKYAPTAHWEVRRGTHEQAKAYCSKEETRLSGPFTYGEEPLGSGARSDLISLKRSIDEGKSQLELFEDHFEPMLKYHKGIALYRSLKVPPRTDKTRVIVLFGPTGTGKSHTAHKSFPNAASVSPPTESKGPIWFDGYDGNFATIIDEFYGWIRHDTMLRLCDAYAYRAPIKGGFINFNSKYLIITSNDPPSKWYDYTKFPDAHRPLERRLDLIIEKHRRGGYKIHKAPIPPRDLPPQRDFNDYAPRSIDEINNILRERGLRTSRSTPPRTLLGSSRQGMEESLGLGSQSGESWLHPDQTFQDPLPGLTQYQSFWGYPNPLIVEDDNVDFSVFFPDFVNCQ